MNDNSTLQALRDSNEAKTLLVDEIIEKSAIEKREIKKNLRFLKNELEKFQILLDNALSICNKA